MLKEYLNLIPKLGRILKHRIDKGITNPLINAENYENVFHFKLQNNHSNTNKHVSFVLSF